MKLKIMKIIENYVEIENCENYCENYDQYSGLKNCEPYKNHL